MRACSAVEAWCSWLLAEVTGVSRAGQGRGAGLCCACCLDTNVQLAEALMQWKGLQMLQMLRLELLGACAVLGPWCPGFGCPGAVGSAPAANGANGAESDWGVLGLRDLHCWPDQHELRHPTCLCQLAHHVGHSNLPGCHPIWQQLPCSASTMRL